MKKRLIDMALLALVPTMRSVATTEKGNAMDLEYTKNVSLILDTQIILMPIRQVIFKGNN